MIEPPAPVPCRTKHNQSIVEPVRQVSEAVCTLVIVDCNARQAFAMGHDALWDLVAADYAISFEVDDPD